MIEGLGGEWRGFVDKRANAERASVVNDERLRTDVVIQWIPFCSMTSCGDLLKPLEY